MNCPEYCGGPVPSGFRWRLWPEEPVRLGNLPAGRLAIWCVSDLDTGGGSRQISRLPERCHACSRPENAVFTKTDGQFVQRFGHTSLPGLVAWATCRTMR